MNKLLSHYHTPAVYPSFCGFNHGTESLNPVFGVNIFYNTVWLHRKQVDIQGCFFRKLEGVAMWVADPPNATPSLGKLNLFQIYHLTLLCHLNQSLAEHNI